MLYMVIEHFAEGRAADIYQRAREHGRQLPAGLDYIDSWVDLEYRRCFQLMRSDDPKLFEDWIGHWQDLVRFEVIAVRPSREAAAKISEGPVL
jgi:Protein of unknown function (DUF3303)